MTQDTTNTIIEHNMLAAHPLYVAAIVVGVIVLIVYITLIRKRKI